MQDFKKLSVWKKGHELTLRIYNLTNAFPKEEKFGLTGQLRRSCASIPANIAEGSGREGKKEFLRFLQIALGSAKETEYHLLLARDLSYMTLDAHSELDGKLEELKRMLSGLISSIRQRS